MAKNRDRGRSIATLSCGSTMGIEVKAAAEGRVEGPFLRSEAPVRRVMYNPGEPGDAFRVSGKVIARNGRTLPGVALAVWQASASRRSHDDVPSHSPIPDEFHLRGKLRADVTGNYAFETIRTGAYEIAPNQFRPAHIDLKVHRAGRKVLTTQLHFPGTKDKATDSWFTPSLVLDLHPEGKRFVASLKIVWAKA